MPVDPHAMRPRASSPPRSTTPIIGRSDEIRTICQHLAGGTRLLTIVGLGGLGKTRVVLEALQVTAAGPVVHWCDVAALAHAEDLLWSIGMALGVELPDLQLTPDPWAVLAAATAALPPHRIVLDAVEGLAPTIAAGLETWLSHSPPTSIVATSRRELGTPSEHVLTLGPLPSGTIDAPATQLLLVRARQLRPGWAEGDEAGVATLAQRLDGWPLLLELVAAEARAASPRTLAQLLDLTPDAHASHAGRAASALHTILDRAWQALSADASRALTRLAALDGTFDLALAAAVLATTPSEALATMAELARHALVLIQDGDDGEPVHRVLDTVREHAAQRGDPDQQAAARTLAARAILARHAATLDVGTRMTTPIPARDLERLFALVERGIGSTSPEALETAFTASRILMTAFQQQRTKLLPVARCSRLVIDSAGALSVPLATRLALATELGRWELPQHLWDVFLSVVEGWLAEADAATAAMTPDEAGVIRASQAELSLHLGLHLEVRLFAEWRYRALLARLTALPAESLVPGSHRWLRHGLFWAFARRGLGLTDLGDGIEGADERHLTDIARVAAANERTIDELNVLVNLAFLAGQLARPHALTLARDVVARCEATATSHAHAYALRELARIEVERGLFRPALARFDAALRESAFLPLAVTETALERVATLLELARVEEAWEALNSLPPGEHSIFSRACEAALRWAVGWCLGRAMPHHRLNTHISATDTVEDDAFAIYWAIDRPELAETIARASHSALFSTRVRQAIRIGHAVLGARQGTVLAVALDGNAFRLATPADGADPENLQQKSTSRTRAKAAPRPPDARSLALTEPTSSPGTPDSSRDHPPWQSLTSKPLLAGLLNALVVARLDDPERTLTKDQLGAILWPGDKSAAEHRDNRLHVAVATLRRLGLGSMLLHDGRGFRLDPARPLVRLEPSVLR